MDAAPVQVQSRKWTSRLSDLLVQMLRGQILVPAVMVVLLVILDQVNPLFGHALSGLLAIGIGILMFSLAWNTFPYSRNYFLVFIAGAMFWVSILDFGHVLTYEGMHIFQIRGTVLSANFWLLSGFAEGLALLAAPLFLKVTYRLRTIFMLMALVTLVLVALVVGGHIPAKWLAANGHTSGNGLSEYLVVALFIAALANILLHRKNMTREVLYLLVAAIVLVASSMVLIAVDDGQRGIAYLGAHVGKVLSNWMIFIAVMRTSMIKPYRNLLDEINTRIRVQRSLFSTNRALHTLRNLHQILAEEDNLYRLLERVCRVIVKTDGYLLAWVGFSENDENKTLIPVARAGLDVGFLDHPHLSWAENPDRGFPPGRAVREGRVVVVQNILKDSECAPCRKDAEKYGFNSLIALPLYEGDKVIGVLAIYASEISAFAGEEIGLLGEFADDLSYGLHALNVRLRHEEVAVSLSETEQMFRNLTEQSLVGVYLVQDRLFRYVNPKLAEILGYTVDELTDRLGPKDVVHKEDWSIVREQLKRRIDYDVLSVHSEFRIVRPNGDIVDVESFGAHTMFKGDVAVIGTLLDITDRKRAEEEIRKSESRLRSIIKADPECVSLLDVEGNILEMNPAGQKMLEADDPSEILGKPLADFADEVKRSELVEIYQKVIAGDACHLEFDVTGLKGKKLCFETSLVPIREQDKISSLLVVSHDVTSKKEAEEVLRNNALQQQTMLIQTIQAVALTVEKRDPYTAGHQRRVSEIAAAIASRMGMDDDGIQGIRLGGMIHDIGKIYVPAEILNRPGKLSRGEFEIIKSHPEVGYEILKDISFPWPVHEMILQHHERMDGSGYPNGISGSEIVIEARILAVADVVEAITSHRPYRPALGVEPAIGEISKGSGTRYDPAVVAACLELLNEGHPAFSQ